MITFLTVLHIIVCILLVLMVLLQFGKGAEAGLLFDTGASSILPQKGNVLTKITTVLAILFLSLSLTLSIQRSKQSEESIFDDSAPVARPLNTDAAPANAPTAAPANQTPESKAQEGTNPSDSTLNNTQPAPGQEKPESENSEQPSARPGESAQ